jgi:hypothetical protein
MSTGKADIFLASDLSANSRDLAGKSEIGQKHLTGWNRQAKVSALMICTGLCDEHVDARV